MLGYRKLEKSVRVRDGVAWGRFLSIVPIVNGTPKFFSKDCSLAGLPAEGGVLCLGRSMNPADLQRVIYLLERDAVVKVRHCEAHYRSC